ncbi:hypothetical protein FG379_001318 [Cryptosporidium bovis]|uniref:uncharacterized protein n=1 Tax=Cryptosporidium bovis TaxID=310047 RepID=UPI00351A521A|nr:hypothetical protein FG379_001318 [Cryptosporidium bovis]
MKLVNMLVSKLLRLVGLFSLLIRGFSHKNLVERMKTNINVNNLEQISIDNMVNKENFKLNNKLKQIIETLENKVKAKQKQVTVGDNTKIRMVKRNSIPSIILDLEVDFGSSKNPMYYGNIDKKLKCSMLLSFHFRKYMINLFENHLEKLNSVFTESHIYFGSDRYHLELRNPNIENLSDTLKHISDFFMSFVINSNFLSEYFLELKNKGNIYFLPDNIMKETFLSIINTQSGHEYGNDIYRKIETCVHGLDVESFTNSYGNSFNRRLKNVEIVLDKQSKLNINFVAKLVKSHFRRRKEVEHDKNSLSKSTETNNGKLNIMDTHSHPYSVLTKKILQISSSRMGNKLVFMFPIKNHTYFQKYKVSRFLEEIITKNGDFKKSLDKYPWIDKISYQFEYNIDNRFSNLLIIFHSNEGLNAEEHPDKFNLVQLLELWLKNLLVAKKKVFEGEKNQKNYLLSYHTPVNQKKRNKSNGDETEPEVNPKSVNNSEKSSNFYLARRILSNLSLSNTIIIIYSNKEIGIKGRDIVSMNARLKENRCQYLLRKCRRFSYLIRKKILPIFGLKYIKYNEEYYFSTKFLSQKVPKSILKYLREKYEFKYNYR